MYKLSRLLLSIIVCFSAVHIASGQHIESDSSQQITDLNKGNLYDPVQLFQGRVAGVSITRPGGDINGDYQIRIRGLNTMTSQNRPLIVLDNMVGVSLDNIDPNDIQSFTVLKESAATALYGMRGANGVILMTSKRARDNSPIATAHTAVSIDRIGKTYDVLDRSAFLGLGGTDYGANTDWVEESTQTGLSEAAGFLVSQQLDKTAFTLSANYRDIEGIVSPSFQKRLNARFGIDHLLLDDKLKVSGQVFFTNSERGTVDPVIFREMTIYNPTAPVLDPGNNTTGGFFQQGLFESLNPVALMKQQQDILEVKRVLLNFSGSYKVLDNLNIRASYTQDNANGFGGQYWSKDDYEIGVFFNGIGNRSTTDSFTEIADFSIDYQKRIKGIDFKFLVGTGFQNRENESLFAQVTQFLFDVQTFNNLGFGALASGPFAEVSSSRTDDRLNSYYGRVNAQFSESFGAYLNLRADSYSGFINNKTGLFYGLGVQYDLIDILDAGKLSKLSLHASYGTSGNLPPSPLLAENIIVPNAPRDLDGDANTTDDIFVAGVQANSRNPMLQWEETKELNLGIDFSIGAWGLSGSFNYFDRKSEDIIYREFVPIGSPNAYDPGTFHTANFVYSNAIDISTSGIEFTLNYDKEIGEVKWMSQLNTTHYQPNTLDRASFDAVVGSFSFSQGGPSNISTRSYVGSPIADLYAPRLLSVDDNGNVQVTDQSFDAWEKVGNALPTTDVGFYNSFSFNSWRLSFLLRGSFGHSLLNVSRWFYESLNPFSAGFNSVVTDQYVGATESTFSDNYIEKASFLRLNNLAIAKTVVIGGDHSLTIELIGQNLFTITNYTGIDPEIRYIHPRAARSLFQGFAAGIDERAQHFTTRTYTLALKISL
ncbi:hypothetical protein BFP97_14250 [Roseivirga sp. 4D4]|uniref:TonB-dependent receptor plug domain-containing protein n=1 Tax=Roseivirga sp. 4D4 TaxID=1889784 RepID=UPI000853AB8D|nr:TonB-dependent receptor plug domain-containing protein [Roseivirga sp. 4D4]OEK02612.1 hypothetical protein BFP97_14250 [Roseivirga sp. 4D4]